MQINGIKSFGEIAPTFKYTIIKENDRASLFRNKNYIYNKKPNENEKKKNPVITALKVCGWSLLGLLLLAILHPDVKNSLDPPPGIL